MTQPYEVIGYAYNADLHCPKCAEGWAVDTLANMPPADFLAFIAPIGLDPDEVGPRPEDRSLTGPFAEWQHEAAKWLVYGQDIMPPDDEGNAPSAILAGGDHDPEGESCGDCHGWIVWPDDDWFPRLTRPLPAELRDKIRKHADWTRGQCNVMDYADEWLADEGGQLIPIEDVAYAVAAHLSANEMAKRLLSPITFSDGAAYLARLRAEWPNVDETAAEAAAGFWHLSTVRPIVCDSDTGTLFDPWTGRAIVKNWEVVP